MNENKKFNYLPKKFKSNHPARPCIIAAKRERKKDRKKDRYGEKEGKIKKKVRKG